MPSTTRANGTVEHNSHLHAGNAYVGPESFVRGGEHLLYGRDIAIREILSLLSAEQLILLHSPSGAGKTSLLQNRIIPQLEATGYQVMPIIRVGLPLADPDTAGSANPFIANTILALDQARPEWASQLEGSARTTGLKAYLEELRDLHGSHRATQVLIFDQFEEIVSADASDEHAKHYFFTELGRALTNPRVAVILSFREEHLSEIEHFLPLLSSRQPAKFRLNLLRMDEARKAIEIPAEERKVQYDDGVIAHLLTKLAETKVRRSGKVGVVSGEFIEPVQLQVICYRLWERLVSPKRSAGDNDRITITRDDLEKAGRIDRILSDFYSDAIATASSPEVPEETIRDWIEKYLIGPGDLRNQVMLGGDRTEGIPTSVLHMLEDHRVVRTEHRRGTSWLELTHDLLVQPVKESNYEWREARPELWRRAREWAESGKRNDQLLSRRQARKYRRAKTPRSDIESEYITRSYVHARARVIMVLVGTVFVGILAYLVGGWAEERRASARRHWTSSTEKFDLQAELRMRSTLEIPREVPAFDTMKNLPSWKEDARPTPRKPSADQIATERAAARALLSRIVNPANPNQSRILWRTDSARVVATLLQRRGFQISLDPLKPGAPNALTFGDSVPLEHVRLIALEMIAEGVPPARLRRFQRGTRTTEVEVAHVDYLQEWPSLPASYIAEAQLSPPPTGQ